MLDDKPRLRISAKQTAKNLWQLDATVEFNEDHFTISDNPEDLGDERVISLGRKLADVLNDAEKNLRADGRKIVGDAES